MKLPNFRQCLLKINPYVPGKPIETVKREFGLDEVIKIASNENPLGPSPLAVEAMKKALEEVHQYPDGSCFELREKLAEHLGVDPSNLIFGNGADEIITYFGETFFCEGDDIIVPECTFSEYIFSANLMGINFIKVPMKDWEIDTDALLKAVTPNTKAVYITNPNNPTGTVIDKKVIDDILDKLPQNCILFLDEAYYEYGDDPDYSNAISYVKDDRNVIIIRTFSKIYGIAGIRVGYGIAPKRIIDLAEKTRLPFNVNRIGQIGALAALDDKEHVRLSRENNKSGKEFLYSEFDKLGLAYKKSQGNFVWVDVKKDSKEVFNALQKMGVIIRAGAPFGAPTHIRVTVGTPRELNKFIECLKKVL